MSDFAIRVEGLSKRYEITVGKHRHDTLRDQISDSMRSLFQRNGRSHGQREAFWALKDISFEVKPGEALGVIGPNGAGKSTLLKILSRITKPTAGRAEICGRVGSLLEVGAGFHGELTGRENIYLNGAILGMKKAEIDRKFDQIVDFSGVEKFVDTPVKRYSSGMYVRLAFAVAAHLEPEILIVDEVLAVGDVGFQNKCLGKMADVSRAGRTVLFVSHNVSAILRLCHETILLDKGQIVLRAPSSVAVDRYLHSKTRSGAEKVWRVEDLPSSCGPFRPIAVRVCNPTGTVTDLVLSAEPFLIEIEYQLTERVRDLRVGIKLYTHQGELLFISFDSDDLVRHQRHHNRNAGHYVSQCRIPANLFNNGTFVAGISASVPNAYHFFMDYSAVRFTVDTTGGVATQWAETRSGFFRPDLEWEIKCR